MSATKWQQMVHIISIIFLVCLELCQVSNSKMQWSYLSYPHSRRFCTQIHLTTSCWHNLTLYLLTRLLVHRWSWQNVMLCARLACSAKPYPCELRCPGVYLCVLLSKFPALYALGQLNGVWRVCQFPVSCPVFTSLAFNTIAYCFVSTYHQQIDAPVCGFIELGTQSTYLASFYVFLCWWKWQLILSSKQF